MRDAQTVDVAWNRPMTPTRGTVAPVECRKREGERRGRPTCEEPEWAIPEHVPAVGKLSGENVVRTFLFVEEMSSRLAERGLGQYNGGVNRHRPPAGAIASDRSAGEPVMLSRDRR